MTASVAYDPKHLTGYRLEQLSAAFDRVRNPRDWKAPIQAVIPIAEQPVVEKAVLWFTDTIPVFVAIPGATDQLVVQAQGYRLGGGETRNGHLRGPQQHASAGVEPDRPWDGTRAWVEPHAPPSGLLERLDRRGPALATASPA